MGACKIDQLFRSREVKYFIYGGIFVAFSLLSLPDSSESLPIQYSNYTRDKYQIEFQYPSDWTIKEKTNRFDEGADITIKDLASGGFFTIVYHDDARRFAELADIRTLTEIGLKTVTEDDYSTEHKVIENPSYLTIGGHEVGTFVYTQKDQLEESAIRYAIQPWNVLVNNHYYIMAFTSSADVFDSPEYIQIRDHFLKSIKFLGQNNATNNNMTNLGRFAE